MSDYLDPNNEELLKDFFSEAQAQIDILEQNILVLENDPKNKDAVDEIFRGAHTLKGGAATVQMMELAEITHTLEDVLDSIRSGKLDTNPELVDALLQGIDVIKAMLEERTSGSVYKKDITPLKNRLESFLHETPAKSQPAPVQQKTQPQAERRQTQSEPSFNVSQSTGGLSEYERMELKDASNGKKVYKVSVHFDESNPMNSVGGIQVFAVLKELGTVLKTNPEFDKLYEDNFFPTVDYYMSITAEWAIVQKKLHITDVTTGFDILEIIEPEQKRAATPAKRATDNILEAPVTSELSLDQEIAKEGAENVEGKKQAQSGSILRVDSKRIDNLLNLVSETVINKATFNQISVVFSDTLSELQSHNVLLRDGLKSFIEKVPEYWEKLKGGQTVKDMKKMMSEDMASIFQLYDPIENKMKSAVSNFKSSSQNLGRIIGELHEGVLRIRMVPIAQIFSRFPRLVRDLTKTLGKKVNLVVEGEDTELDKSVIEDLLDPLIHCVRNAIDHGIEDPDTREDLGKDAEGILLLTARNEGNMIVIVIGDDGKGIEVETIKRKAVERGLIHPTKMLTDVEAFNLIFEPGFSTAKTVTNISGRGVGLDVVRKQIEKLNGTVSIWSEKGKGTKFTVKLPLTLAIIQGLLVKVGKEVYVIPITSVIDSHRIKPSEIKIIDNYEVFNVRKDVISLLRLSRLFGVPSDEGIFQFIVVVGSGDKKMGLLVDSLIGEEDVVIKPLKDTYTLSPGIAGATILGDGKVSLIIDVSQLLELGFKNERALRDQREVRAR